LWIFDPTLEYNVDTSIAGLAAALGWLLASLCFMVYFFYISFGRQGNSIKSKRPTNVGRECRDKIDIVLVVLVELLCMHQCPQ